MGAAEKPNNYSPETGSGSGEGIRELAEAAKEVKETTDQYRAIAARVLPDEGNRVFTLRIDSEEKAYSVEFFGNRKSFSFEVTRLGDMDFSIPGDQSTAVERFKGENPQLYAKFFKDGESGPEVQEMVLSITQILQALKGVNDPRDVKWIGQIYRKVNERMVQRDKKIGFNCAGEKVALKGPKVNSNPGGFYPIEVGGEKGPGVKLIVDNLKRLLPVVDLAIKPPKKEEKLVQKKVPAVKQILEDF